MDTRPPRYRPVLRRTFQLLLHPGPADPRPGVRSPGRVLSGESHEFNMWTRSWPTP
ncbi:MAG: hypothetical protein MZU95_15770 [Desulfomicrobium escambiense]|nr:hypothetical protein [Desulfomicrobium escambiense]